MPGPTRADTERRRARMQASRCSLAQLDRVSHMTLHKPALLALMRDAGELARPGTRAAAGIEGAE